MFLGEGLIEAGMVRKDDVEAALEHQKKTGVTLGESLVALGILTVEQLDGYFNFSILPIKTIEESGLDPILVMTLVLKIISVYGLETASEIAGEIKLPNSIVAAMLEQARERALIESLGSVSQGLAAEVRFTLSGKGKEWVSEAMAQSQYVGPAPVSLSAYQMQTEKQRISHDRVDEEGLQNSLSHLVLSEEIRSNLGPALNFGRAMLLYGAPGNGKTSIAMALAQSFQQYIYVPYCIEVSNQIINIYDPEIHTEVDMEADAGSNEKELSKAKLRRSMSDPRWMRCRRPIAITGGELTLEMLDLNFNQYAKYYEAPLQVKATGGVFIIDDFGRQMATPEQVLNRWVVPLERGFDYLTLHTGKKFPIRFDGLVIFSTNIPPERLLDAAMMRRIPYNFLIGPPTKEDYSTIFDNMCTTVGLKPNPKIIDYLMKEVYGKELLPLARYHPKFIMEHVIARCRYRSVPISLELNLVKEAVTHLFTKHGQGVSMGVGVSGGGNE